MVDVVSAVSSVQNAVLKPSVQSTSAPSAPLPPSTSSTDFVTSGIVMDNLQNVAILEYRSSQTGQVVQQYPDQAQINAFKAAEHLARQAASLKQPQPQEHMAVSSVDVHQTQTTAPAPSAAGGSDAGSAGSSGSVGSSGGNTTTSIVA